ncbi:MAG: potassium channel family protein [Actinomycetota bacterium]|nr:potassium channel family protein [Actinomycetota bacterium]
MIPVLLGAGGVLLILAALVDVLWTTLWPEGAAGPLTACLSSRLWGIARSYAGPRRNHRVLSLAGPFILIVTVFIWIVMLVAGWALFFDAQPSAVLDVRTREPADLSGRIWFVLYTLFTLGNGDYVPNGDAYQLAAGLTVATGMFLITLAVTYLLSVVSAVAQKRSFASQVSALGNSPEEVVLAAWDSEGFGDLAPQLVSLTSALGLLAEQHQAYPILHYYHPTSESKATGMAVTVFDEALTIFEHGIEESYRPKPAALKPARGSVSSYLTTLRSAFITAADRSSPPPDLTRLRKVGVPVVSDEQFAAALEELSHRRRLLLGLLVRDGWSEE